MFPIFWLCIQLISNLVEPIAKLIVIYQHGRNTWHAITFKNHEQN